MDLELTRIFVKVVQNGSFSRAAALLKLPKSTVSKAISRLESETGTKLMIRTTRSLSLTAAGRAFFDVSSGPVQILEDAQKSLHGGDSLLSGLIRMTAPEDLGAYVLASAIANLTLQHPKLNFEMHYTNEVVDLVKDGFDLAVRIGSLPESSFKARRVGEVVLIMVATPTYLSGKPKIRHPADLKQFACLTYSGQEFRKWNLRSAKEKSQVTIVPRILSNQMSSLLNTALAHGGIALVPSYLCHKEIKEGRLVRVLPEWSSAGLTVSLVSPLAPSSSVKLKITTDQILKSMQSVLS